MKAFLALLILLIWTGVAYADVCLLVDREGSWMNDLKQGEVNQMISAGQLTQEEYDARSMPYDIIAAYDVSKCEATGTTGSKILTVIIRGISLADAQQYVGAWWEMTGEVDDHGSPLVYLKRDSKFGLKNMPPQVENVIGVQDYFEIQWSEICGYVQNKLTDLTGAMCP